MSTDTQDEKPQPATLEAALGAHGVTMTAQFVPWSKSRNKDEKDDRGNRRMSLNWLVTIFASGRPVLTTDYMAGEGHCPSYKQGARRTVDYDRALEHECETGKAARHLATLSAAISGKPILPSLADVMHSLLLDASAIDSPTYEDWAGDFGYEPDSRKGEAIYRQCLDHALRLRAALGDTVLQQLREAAEGY